MTEMRDKIARAIDPSAWEHRDECLTRREAWESEIKIGWGDTTFGQWANRGVGKSLEKADAVLALYAPVMEENERLREALQPFANCVEQIKATEDDEEWAKFRLLIKDYRRAAKAVGLTLPGLKRCSTCGGEFDEGEWDASSECPECETPKTRAALSPKSEKQECPEADELERRAREIEGDSDNPLRVAAANRLYAEASALRSEKQLSALRKWRGA